MPQFFFDYQLPISISQAHFSFQKTLSDAKTFPKTALDFEKNGSKYLDILPLTYF